MKMLIKSKKGPKFITARTPMAAAQKLIEMGIKTAGLFEAAHPHTGRVIRIEQGVARLVR